ncbi:UDP-2,4-diacetamido-2,4,6-trideoxy-beta-L-altropyranose hydrolase [Marinomonas transparens]|uniref:UDP-2,4-diacetamido-2,4, 6-trideoxy-beta-L-altropyranose hydrolase n=1 Tax=Marinomonas transparens TaxID=2795388 RepID=A0A934N488_9GAMM|nr:UDP-2,4-diacetamido-2,4,6-trideoxy-beta-L-altropyranose hydrolase [Marinomonas transparens]MBJ7539813.1 UDP-2,4-diacetamido-2,4,6-trideoxy-beta-L-altropyranose hydrolase [Marinomonas transparens]
MKALVRADASVEIGMGHRVRCQALIQALTNLGWQCQFVVHQQYEVFASPEDLIIATEGDFFVLAELADLVILDHYQYQAVDIAQLFQHQANLLVLDDMNDRGDFPAKWLLNPLNESYSGQVESPLLGSQYALLRPAFRQAEPIPHNQARQLLITLGGTDPLGLTLPILEGLLASGFDLGSIQVLLGKNATNATKVKAFCQQEHIAWKQGLSDVTSLMKQAKLSVSAAGGTLFELACMGIPTIFAQVAENQTRSLQQHVPLNWCKSIRFDNVSVDVREVRIKQLIQLVNLQWHDLDWQQQARKVASSLVDGYGADRVAKMIHDQLVNSPL